MFCDLRVFYLVCFSWILWLVENLEIIGLGFLHFLFLEKNKNKELLLVFSEFFFGDGIFLSFCKECL